MTIERIALFTALELAERNADPDNPRVQGIANSQGERIGHILLSHEDGFDIIIIGASSMDNCGWTEMLGVLDYSVKPLGAMGGIWEDALLLRTPAVHRPRLLPFFHDLVSRVSPSSVRESTWAIVDEWSELFNRIGSPLSIMEQRGLFGELLVLEKLVDTYGDQSVSWWVGPKAERHDFISDTWEIEVKSSIHLDPVAHIHPIDQLEPTALPLHLIMVGLDSSGSTSLSELVMRIEGLIDETASLALFRDLLGAVGFNVDEAHHYPTKYDASSIGYLSVDSSTPILRPSSISPGTVYEDVRWTLRKSSLPFIDVTESYWPYLGGL